MFLEPNNPSDPLENSINSDGILDSIRALPTKPNLPYQLKFKEIDLVSNHFNVKFDKLQRIYMYFVDFAPKVESDFRKVKQMLIESIKESLMKEIGMFFLSGSTLFGSEKPNFSQSISFKTCFEKKNYELTVILSKSFTINEIFNEDKKSAILPQKFFNILIKYFLKKLKFFEFGRTSKFYDPSKSCEIEQTKLLIYHGFHTSFNNYDGGFFLRIDVSHKIVRTDTVLQLIDRIYNDEKNHERSKDDKRKLAKDTLVGKVVLAMYGNYRYWRIDDVLFDKDCNTFLLEERAESADKKHNMTLVEYYKEKYNMEIRKPRQPLLVHIQMKTNKIFYILPEFCVMTGIPDDFNDMQKKKVTDLCIKAPDKRMIEIEGLTRELNQEREDPMCPKKLCESLGISIDPCPIEFKAKLLKEPTILFGNEEFLGEKTAHFQVNKPPFSDAGEFPWAILYFREFKVIFCVFFKFFKFIIF